jgi:YVTN family beta-propeller protein
MPRYLIIFLLLCGMSTLGASSAAGKNELEIFGVPDPGAEHQLKSAQGGQVNLALEAFTAPASANQGEDISHAVTFSFRNTGPDPINVPFLARIVLSPSPEIEIPIDDYVFWVVVPGLDAGEAWSFDGGAVVPFGADPGDVFFVAQVDPGNNLDETDETDNLLYLPVTLVEAPRSLIYYEDFQGGDGGWVARDLTEQDIHLQHTFYMDEGTEKEYGVWWCGDDDPNWDNPPGYGTDWDQRLTKEFFLPEDETVLVSYAIQYDTEPNNDRVLIEVSDNAGAVFTTLADHSGSTDGQFSLYSQDLSAYAGQEVLIRFRFTSDGSWDDEAGNLDTDGAFRLDYVEVTGFDFDDFEYDGNGWTPSAADPVGGEFRLVAVPDFTPGLPGDVYDNGELATTCNAWVAYDPGTLEFPDASPTERAAGRDLEIAIESPEITLPTSWSHVLLSFDVYQDLPIDNGILFRWFVSGEDGVWETNGYLYYGTMGWNRREFDVTDLIPPGTTSIKIRLAANDFGHIWGWDPPTRNAAPFFDNIQVVLSESNDPGLDPASYPRACGWSVDDLDGDGVYDVDDLCPTESAAFFDRDGDGCIDPVIGSRHIEYWSDDALPLGYVIHEDGAPGISDGSDFTAIQDGFLAWTAVPGAEVTVDFLGTTPDPDANAVDMVNTVTFADPDYPFPSGVLAVGLSTSYLTPVVDGATVIRPGQIIDTDMIFNPTEDFQTLTDGSGIDIRSIVTHEAGHMLGLAHSAVQTSTMFFVLPPGTDASVLSVEDEMAMFRAYPEESVLAGASHLRGSVYDGLTGSPVPGVIAYAIEALPGDVVGDTLACEYTLPSDGSYHFAGLPDGEYFVAIHPLDGSSEIGFIQPANINQLIYDKAEALVVPEYWDADESSTDDSDMRTPISVIAGATFVADIFTNIDDVGPTVVAYSPLDGATDVAVSTAILIQFSEAVAGDSFIGNFNFNPVGGGFVPGNAALVQDDHTLMYVPSANLDFDTTYEVEIGGGVQDLFGNPMGDSFPFTFTTESKPPVFIDNLSPNKGIGGALVVINGEGFGSSTNPATVTIDGESVEVLEWASDRLLVAVPLEMPAGPVDLVVNDPVSGGSAITLFTVLSADDAARGLEIATVDLPGLPRVVEVSPDGMLSYVATDAGLSVVDVSDPSDPGLSFLPVSGGLNDLDVSPDGNSIFAVSRDSGKLYRYQYDDSVVPPGEQVSLLNEITLSETPRGIKIGPAGKRAYLTTVAEIQVWDINPSSSTFENQVGVLTGTGPVLLGPLAIDPAGRYLFAATGSGDLAVFDLPSATLVAEVAVQSTPIDVQIDPTGRWAYVTDDTGYLSVVDLESLTKVFDLNTGGSLKGAAVTPSASFIYGANHQYNDLDVIDLREGSATFRGLATRIPSRVNPVDLVFSPDGIYAYSLVESERKFVITAVGAGPLLAALTPSAGPPGSKVVLSGSGFTDATVSFNGDVVPVERSGDGYLAITLPPTAVTGPVTVVGVSPGEISNSLVFQVLSPSEGGMLHSSGTVQPSGGPQLANALVVVPGGDLVLIGGEDGSLHLFDTDPGSPAYHQFHDSSAVFGSAISGLAVAPDASVAYAGNLTSGAVQIVDVNPLNSSFGDLLGSLALGVAGVGPLTASPDGGYLLATDPGAGAVLVVDLATESVFSTSIPQGAVTEMVFHPGGAYAYLVVQADTPAVVVVLDMDPQSEGFGTVAAEVSLPAGVPDEVPVSLSFAPDGELCYLLTSQLTGAPNRSLVSLDTSDPGNPTAPIVLGVVPTASAPLAEHIRVSPVGDRAVFNIRSDGLFQLELDPVGLPSGSDLALGSEALDFAFSPLGTHLYVADTQDDAVHIFDFEGDQQLVKVWGDGQTGVAEETLPSPLRVRVIDSEGSPVVGAAVTFEVQSGGGEIFTVTPPANGTSLTLATDIYGYAQVEWTLGSVLGLQEVAASAPGAAGSPALFQANAIDDPELLPLELIDNLFHPLDGTADVSVTTVVQATFSRPVDPASIHVDSYFLWDQSTATKVPTVTGLANSDRDISLTPVNELSYGTTFTIVVTGDVRDTSGGALVNPTDISFATEAPPAAPSLTAVSPPSATVFVDVTISGAGFDFVPSDNQVFFVSDQTSEEFPAYVCDGATDFLLVTVPSDAETGTIYVSSSAGVSNQIPFTVLVESSLPEDDVIGGVSTGSPTRSVTVSPDGAMAYAVSPEADLIIPIDLNTLISLPGIPVGDEPWAIAMHPAGTNVYVANRSSGDVSIIDVLPGSGTQHDVIATLNVGIEPVDILVDPAGDRVYVANYISEDMSVIDTDESSATHNFVIGSVGTGSGARSITISPDGTRVYVGTDVGYLVIGTLDYGVISHVNTGTGTRNITISPDGTLLVLLDVTGQIFLYDITPGSDTENQVIASVGTGSGARSATVSPDGALLYVVMEENDVVLVFQIDVGSSIGARNSQVVKPIQELQLVATIQAGENPEELTFLPDGSRRWVMTSSGDNMVTVYGPGGDGHLSGRVYAECPEPDTGLYGVSVDVFLNESGELVR